MPYRKIYLSPTHQRDRVQENPPIPVYDTSGPYTDPEIEILIGRGLPKLRNHWIEERGDTELLRVHSSRYAQRWPLRAEHFLWGSDRAVAASDNASAAGGANVLVTGSAIFGTEDGMVAAMKRLRAAANQASN